MEKCIYCGEDASYQFKNGKWCCSSNMNRCTAIRAKRKQKTKESWANNTRSHNEKSEKNVDGINKCEYGCGKIAEFKLKNNGYRFKYKERNSRRQTGYKFRVRKSNKNIA